MRCKACGLLLFFGLILYKADAQLTIFAGPQISSAKYTISETDQPTSSKQGFMAGATYKTLIEGPAYFSPMIYFSRKGYKVAFNKPAFPPDSGAVNNSTSINTIQFAPLVQFNFSKKASYLFVRFGPSFDLNLSGKEEFDSTNGKHISRDMVFSFADYSYATTSINFHLGFQHKSGFSIFTYYDFGIGSLNNADYGPTIFHRAAGVAVGWKFGRRR